MRIFFTWLLVFISPVVFAQQFYKWVDEKGVTHISDKPISNADNVTVTSFAPSKEPENDMEMPTTQKALQINNQQQSVIIYQQQAAPQNVQQPDFSDIDRQINSLRQDISNLERQKRMDPSMEPLGLRRDIREKEERISELLMMKSGQSGQNALHYRNEKKAVQALEGIERNTRTPHVIFVQ